MKSSIFVIALLTCFGLAACKPQTAAPVTAPALVTQPVTPAAATTVAGTYSGMLPCADCEGMDTRLLLTADGKYTLTQIYQDKDHSSFVSEGGYTLESDGKTVHLRPTNKDEYDGYYEVLSPTQLRMLDREGKPVDSPLNYTLTRK